MPDKQYAPNEISLIKTVQIKDMQQSDIEKIKELIKEGTNLNIFADSMPPLYHAVNNGNLEIVKLLVENGADVNVKNVVGQTPLHEAARCGYFEIVKYLIDKGADINAYDCVERTPLDYARLPDIRDLLFNLGGTETTEEVIEE